MKNEDGYELWLRYQPVNDTSLLADYKRNFSSICIPGKSNVLDSARSELATALSGLLGTEITEEKTPGPGCVLCCTTEDAVTYREAAALSEELSGNAVISDEAYAIRPVAGSGLVICGKTDRAVLYGVFAFLRMLETHTPVPAIGSVSRPRISHRVLNHWDNLDRTVERGYAGMSLWDWQKLPRYHDPRYTDYARACASVGINGTVLNNVNANALSLTPMYLERTRALADIFRPWGLKVYLSVKFSAPMILGKLKTADPLNEKVKAWWKNKAEEIHGYIPDFGGFVVKANSEGQPGPQDYDRSHADGANMLAEALRPFGGTVMWRAFVYKADINEDRIKQACNEFIPHDGKFADNVLVQVKNGPLDFQPREPFSPLFGSMPKTPLMVEFQLAQEYLGFSSHLVYLAPMFRECLEADTEACGKGSTVARIIDGTLHNYRQTGIAAVTNIGNDRNWCGHPFAQANWYAYGRLAWDHSLTSEQVAEEWLAMTFSTDGGFIKTAKKIMLQSRENCVNYMTPLGLHHIMSASRHYGPGPWVDAKEAGRIDWSAIYFHRAGKNGIGFDRTKTGSNAVSQYHGSLPGFFSDLKSCPENLLLWFHRLSWDYRCKSGRTLWEELCFLYNRGVSALRQSRKDWASLEGLIDDRRFRHVSELLQIQEDEAVWWRDACLSYFSEVSGLAIPEEYEQPKLSLEEYKAIRHPFAPGI